MLLACTVIWNSNLWPQSPTTHAPENATTCLPLSVLINTVRPEFAAKGLLYLAETDVRKDQPANLEFLSQAFLKARLSSSPLPLKPLGLNLSTRTGLAFFGQDLGTDTLTLQSRAAEDFAVHDWQHAFELFRSIDLRSLPALTCGSEFTYDLSPYFHAAAKLISIKPERALDIISFILQNSLRPAGVPAALGLLSNAKLSQSDTETTVVLLVLALKQTQPSSVEFIASLKDLPQAINRANIATATALSRTEQQNLSDTLRDYIIRNLDAPRCAKTSFGEDLALRSGSKTLAQDLDSGYSGLSDLNQALVAAYQPPITIEEASPTKIVEADTTSDQADSAPLPIYSELRHLRVDSELSDQAVFNNEVTTLLNNLGKSDTQISLGDPSIQTALVEGQILRLLDNKDRSIRNALTSRYLEAVVGALDGTPNDYALLSDFILTERMMMKNQRSQQTTEWMKAVCEEGNADLQFINASDHIGK